MKTFEYSAKLLTPTDRLFDAETRNDPWILFHGTSSVHESVIDNDGIQVGRLPTSMEEVRNVVCIFKSMNWRVAPASSLLTYCLRRDNGDASPRPISLAHMPEQAASYCGVSTAGGEVAGLIRDAIAELRKFTRSKAVRDDSLRLQLEEYEVNVSHERPSSVIVPRREWVRAQIRRFSTLEKQMRAIRRSYDYGVIYAVRFYPSDLDVLEGYHEFTFSSDIPPDRFVAKARISGNRELQLNSHLTRFHRDLCDPCSLIGAVTKRQRADAKPVCNNKGSGDPWDELAADPSAGLDLVKRYRHEDLIAKLKVLQQNSRF
jgi:hypothetical protein